MPASMARPPSEPDTSRYRGRLGAAVRSRREKLGLSIAELRDRLETHGASVSKAALYKYESGERPIVVDDLPAFAAALQTSIRQLLPNS